MPRITSQQKADAIAEEKLNALINELASNLYHIRDIVGAGFDNTQRSQPERFIPRAQITVTTHINNYGTPSYGVISLSEYPKHGIVVVDMSDHSSALDCTTLLHLSDMQTRTLRRFLQNIGAYVERKGSASWTWTSNAPKGEAAAKA